MARGALSGQNGMIVPFRSAFGRGVDVDRLGRVEGDPGSADLV